MKKIIVLGIMAMMIFTTGCGGEAPEPKLNDPNEEICVEEICVEEIHVEEIHVEEINIKEIGVNTWDNIDIQSW